MSNSLIESTLSRFRHLNDATRTLTPLDVRVLHDARRRLVGVPEQQRVENRDGHLEDRFRGVGCFYDAKP